MDRETAMRGRVAMAAAMLMLGACTARTDEANQMDGNGVSLRNLTDTEVAREAGDRQFRLQGTAIPTPSDTRSRYFLLRERQAIGGNIIAILREERGDRIAYARVEVDCGGRLFHVLGVGPSRAAVETARAADGPLRPIAGLPLRQDLASFICQRSNTPLAPA
jgi:hypothetical protein